MEGQLKRLSSQLGSPNDAAIVSAKTMLGAARNGHLEVVKWLYEEFGNDPVIDIFKLDRCKGSVVYAMDAAASKGHLEVLKYLHELKRSIDLTAKKRKRGEQKTYLVLGAQKQRWTVLLLQVAWTLFDGCTRTVRRDAVPALWTKRQQVVIFMW
ncbi:hypothetical protein PR001_g31914 [Phytophthora rubi]|uniref:Uncharacterized protein n=1 Tax=Phytophthora rubi TaxID=129364 RepID=A0A6A3GHK2_9STRA|nr:hypothetical protein PR001_g31914 [Phytophthora rubi]